MNSTAKSHFPVVASAVPSAVEEEARRGKWLWRGEGPGWEKRRMEEDRERMEEGWGIGDLIKERVREVLFGEEDGEGEGENKGEGG